MTDRLDANGVPSGQMLTGVHTAMQDAQHQNAAGGRAVVNGM